MFSICKFNKIYREAEGVDNGGAETPAATPSETPTAPAAAAENSTPAATPTAETPTADIGFKIPDEYKDKPWAAKVKSNEDLYKQIDGLNTLVGKKNAYPASDATPEQLSEYYSGLRPESATAYDFGEGSNPESAKNFGEMLYKSNVSAHQAKTLIAEYQAYEQNLIAEGTSADGFAKVMTERFGEKYDGVVSAVSKSLDANVNEQTKTLIDSMPNQYLGAMYEVVNGLLKAHGVNEGGDNLHGSKAVAPNSGVSIETQRSEIRAQIRTLESRAHTAQQKQELVDRLQATYTK